MTETATEEKRSLKPVNTRIAVDQDAFIKSEVKKSKGVLTEGEVHRALLDEAITNRKNK